MRMDRSLRQDVTHAAIGAAGIGLMYLLLGWMLTGCQPYEAAWRTTAAVREAGTLVDQSLARAAKHRMTVCKQAGGDWRACARASREYRAVTEWRRWGIPAVNSAVSSTVAALQIAERVRGHSKIDWLALLRPAGCALSRVLRQWTDLMGPARGAVEAVTATLGAMCR